MKWVVLILCISIIAFCSGFVLSSRLSTSGSGAKIVDRVVHKTEYIYMPTTPSEYKSCYDSSIHIDAKINDDIMQVYARDKCKRAEAEFRVSVGQSSSFKYYVAGAFVAGAVFVALIR